MTETTPEQRVNGHQAPHVSLLKFNPEPAVKAPAAVEDKPRPRRRLRIDHLRRVVVETRSHGTYRLLVRHGSYIVGGTRILTRRAWDARTSARYERMMRAAEAGGNEELVREWEQRITSYRAARQKRRLELLQMVVNAPKVLLTGTAASTGLLLLIGVFMAFSNHDIADVVAPMTAVIEFVALVAYIAGIIWDPLLAVLPWAVLAAVWTVGRKQHTAPQWALPATTAAEDRDMVPDEGAILKALSNLGIAPLSKALKEGWQPRWVQPTTRSGNGWHTQLMLPMGVSVEMIAAAKKTLAHNLLRKSVEVWPVEPRDQAGVLDLWVADPGVLTKPVPPWPLLTEGTSDFFRGVPVGINARGDQVIGRLMAANYLVAGIMGSGKSSLVVALLLGAMLDPLVEIDVHVLAYNSDYDPMRPRLRSLVKGDDGEHIVAAMDTLRSLASEVSRRGQELERIGTDTKVTREMAERDASMRPRIVVFDEVHELFSHREHGQEAKELALKVTKKARKTAIMLLWITPDADANSLPRGIAKTVSHRVAFAINDHQGNDAILGTGAHKRGYSATTLVAGEDVGTAMAAGFGKTPGLIRSYYVRKEAGVDEITPVVERAVALREGIAPAPAAPTPAVADPLTDVAHVLGDVARLSVQEVLQRLAALNPGAYRGWDPTALKRALEPHGCAQYKSAGRMVVARDRVQDAILERLADTTDDEGGTGE